MINPDMSDIGFEVPEIIDHDKNIYVMKRCNGVTLSKIINPPLFKELIYKFFTTAELYYDGDIQESNLKKQIYKDFYYDKIRFVEGFIYLYLKGKKREW